MAWCRCCDIFRVVFNIKKWSFLNLICSWMVLSIDELLSFSSICWIKRAIFIKISLGMRKPELQIWINQKDCTQLVKTLAFSFSHVIFLHRGESHICLLKSVQLWKIILWVMKIMMGRKTISSILVPDWRRLSLEGGSKWKYWGTRKS